MIYEYVNVKTTGLFTANSYEHRDIIDEYAKNGYRFVCCIPTAMEPYGKIRNYDLVFEKDED